MATYREDPAQLWSQPPTETDEVATLFDTIHAGTAQPDELREAAERANQAIDDRLMQQHGKVPSTGTTTLPPPSWLSEERHPNASPNMMKTTRPTQIK